ncbi:MAG: hypothetical protein L0L22_16575 [Staphylococcus equorum]|uniref:Uncharacterized protein n=1 Tax=Tetragenococcus halophilus TaxID=51669 RepID=A0AB35HR62_TETHA|nr:hypothetical protein [Tetragenococcus halophilus]MDN6196321.1 hypothetical protein [Atopostipes suicloacalis]MDN6496999.1 hypothetical protein [Tetragenococcus koreensis]MDN6572590.1 hypothetical protein [Staphylococcus equorum]MCO8296258.1 hypothetical protein [Tetragenococcus halophilus]MCO8298759.1 hypothetical protein [Tetragenococcus halophilus]
MFSDYQTELLKEKIKLMKLYKAENEFYRIKGLFIKGINVEEIVKTFQEEYDTTFNFKGTPKQLYKKIEQQLTKKNS